MNDDYVNLYSDAQRYDLVIGAYATGDFLDFYQQQITRYGEPVLELACGSGRLTIPLAEAGIEITGLDISEEMLNLARLKASERRVKIFCIQRYSVFKEIFVVSTLAKDSSSSSSQRSL